MFFKLLTAKGGAETIVTAREATTPTTASTKTLTPSKASTSHGSSVTLGPLSQNLDAVVILSTHDHRNLGLFATQDFPARHKIIVERPLVSCIHFCQQYGKVKNIYKVWTRLTHQRRRELTLAFTPLRKIPVEKTLSISNQLKLEKFIEDYAFWDPNRSRAHVFRLTSHINHACTSCANAQHWTDLDFPNYMTVTLVKPVQTGDEIFIHYGKRRMGFGCAVCGAYGNSRFSEGRGNGSS
ncbi:hypothetical protein ACJ41O_002377 [Fusarium nematophilum]